MGEKYSCKVRDFTGIEAGWYTDGDVHTPSDMRKASVRSHAITVPPPPPFTAGKSVRHPCTFRERACNMLFAGNISR